MKKNNTQEKREKNKNGVSKKGMAAAAVGAAAVGAGVYYFLGPNKKEHQKKAKALMGKIKKEAAREFKKAKELSTPLYHKAVDVVAENYAGQYKAHEKEIRAIAEKIKAEWTNTKKTAKPSAKKSGRKSKKSA